MTPLIILVGEAGVGKDTVANFMVQQHGAISVAQSSPMKRFARQVFDFTDDQLWGPSASRNVIDPRPNTEEAWEGYRYSLLSVKGGFLNEINLPWSGNELMGWFNDCRATSLKTGLTPRRILQSLGTEYGRKNKKDVWVNYADRTASAILNGGYTYSDKEGLIKLDDDDALAAKWVVIPDGRFPSEVVAVKSRGGFAIKIEGTSTTAKAQEAGIVGHASEVAQAGIPPEWFNYIFPNDKRAGLKDCEYKVHKLMNLLASPRYLTV